MSWLRARLTLQTFVHSHDFTSRKGAVLTFVRERMTTTDVTTVLERPEHKGCGLEATMQPSGEYCSHKQRRGGAAAKFPWLDGCSTRSRLSTSATRRPMAGSRTSIVCANGPQRNAIDGLDWTDMVFRYDDTDNVFRIFFVLATQDMMKMEVPLARRFCHPRRGLQDPVARVPECERQPRLLPPRLSERD